MDMLLTCFRNVKTTGVGIAGATVVATFSATAIPPGPIQALGFLLAIVVLALGFVSKDATTGSQPPAKP